MRKILDRTIGGAAVLACLLLVAMVVATFATIVLRPFGVLVSGHEEIATFAMVGMAFLGLPYAYRTGAHVRVETLLNRLSQRPGQGWTPGACWPPCVICAAFTYFAFWLVFNSYVFGDVSEGLLSIPRWIPQLPIVLGLVLFALALLDDLMILLQGGKASFEMPPRTRRNPGRISSNWGTMASATGMLALLLLLFGLLASGSGSGLRLGAVGLSGFSPWGEPSAGSLVATALWSSINSWPLTAMPLFLLMGELLFRTRLADDMFRGLSPWVAGSLAACFTSTSSAAAFSRQSSARPACARRPSAVCRSLSSSARATTSA